MDAGVDGEADLGTLLGLDTGVLAVDDPVGVALQEPGAGRSLQDIVVGCLDLGLPLNVRLVKIKLSSLLLVDFTGHADIAEEVRGHGPVNIVADGFECYGDSRQVQVVFAEAGHGLEIKILPVDVGHFGIVTEMDL